MKKKFNMLYVFFALLFMTYSVVGIAMAADPGEIQNLYSTSHVSNQSSNNTEIEVEWEPAEYTPLAGYYTSFTSASQYTLTEINTAGLELINYDITEDNGVLNNDGIYYFHIAAVADDGEIGATSTIGPFIIDTVDPTNPSVSFPITTTTTRNVILTLFAGGAAQMFISNSNSYTSIADSEWEDYTTSKEWTLTDGQGTKTVYAQFRDSAENITDTPASASIEYIIDTLTVELTPVYTIINADSIAFTATFNKSTTDFEASDINVTNGTVDSFTQVGDVGDVYTFNIIPTKDGEITIDISDDIVELTPVVITYDKTPPEISLTNDTEVFVKVGTVYNDIKYEQPTVSDNQDEDLVIDIDASNVDTSKVGTYFVTFNVTDSAGNEAVEVKRTVKVYEPATVTPTGNVKDKNGTPLEAVTVSSNASTFTISTNADGNFTYTPLAANMIHYLTFEHNEYVKTTVKFYGQENFEIVLLDKPDDCGFVSGTSKSLSDDVLSNVFITLEASGYSATGLSDSNGQYIITIDKSIDTYNLSAEIYGYWPYTQTEIPTATYAFTDTVAKALDFTMTQRTAITVEIEIKSNEVEIAVKAIPQFSDNESFLNGTEIVFDAGSTSPTGSHIEYDGSSVPIYVVEYPHESLNLTIKADTTTKEKNANIGYFTSRILTISVPSEGTVTSTVDVKSIAEAGGLTISVQSNDQTVKVDLPGDGLIVSLIPQYIEFTILQYNGVKATSSSILSVNNVTEIELTDEYGNDIDGKGDNDPLKKLYVTLKFKDPVTKAKLLDKTYEIHHADSLDDLLSGKGVSILLDESNFIDDNAVKFEVTHLSFFGIVEEEEPSDDGQHDLSTSGPHCFVSTSALPSEIFASMLFITGLLIIAFGLVIIRRRRKLHSD
ncbi:exported hypothetical protein [Candidatus Magnetomoraceae bacterium gMMP-15]